MKACSCGSPVTHRVPAWERAGMKGGLCADCALRYEANAEWRYRMHCPVPIETAQASLFEEAK